MHGVVPCPLVGRAIAFGHDGATRLPLPLAGEGGERGSASRERASLLNKRPSPALASLGHPLPASRGEGKSRLPFASNAIALPLWGRVREGGSCDAPSTTPTLSPSPQGGGEHAAFAGR